MKMIETLNNWLAESGAELEALGITAELEHAPTDRSKSAAWIDLASVTAIGRLTVWETGECEIQIAKKRSGDVRTEHHDLQSDSDLLDILGKLVRRLDSLVEEI